MPGSCGAIGAATAKALGVPQMTLADAITGDPDPVVRAGALTIASGPRLTLDLSAFAADGSVLADTP